MILDRLSVASRVKALGGVSIAAVASLAGAGFVGEALLAGPEAREARMQAGLTDAQSLENQLLNLSRVANEFLLARDDALAQEFAPRVADARETLDRLDEVIDASVIQALSAQIDAYSDTLDVILGSRRELGLTESQGLEGSLRKAVHDVETVVDARGVDALKVKMLMMRRHEKDFMLRQSAEYVDKLDQRVGEFSALVNRSGLPAADRDKLLALVAAYRDGFHAWSDARMELSAAVETSRGQFAALRDGVATVTQDMSETAAALRADVAAFRQRMLWISLALVALIGVAVFLASRRIGASISQPILRLSSDMRELVHGQGQAATAQEGRTGGTELDDMEDALALFRRTLDDAERMRAGQMEERASQTRRDEQERLVQMIETHVGGLIDAVRNASSDLQQSSRAMAASMSAIQARGRQTLVHVSRAGEFSHVVSSAVGKLDHAVDAILAEASRTRETGDSAVADTLKLGSTVEQLRQAATDIGEVVNIITSIASSTNLLALNATIEAARAGESGRGFAVVASEVKSLANQTVASTASVARQIERIRACVADVESVVGQVSGRIGDMSAMAGHVMASVDEQKHSTSEIASHVIDTASATEAVEGDMGHLMGAVEIAGAEARKVQEASLQLTREADALKANLSGVLGRLRTA